MSPKPNAIAITAEPVAAAVIVTVTAVAVASDAEPVDPAAIGLLPIRRDRLPVALDAADCSTDTVRATLAAPAVAAVRDMPTTRRIDAAPDAGADNTLNMALIDSSAADPAPVTDRSMPAVRLYVALPVLDALRNIPTMRDSAGDPVADAVTACKMVLMLDSVAAPVPVALRVMPTRRESVAVAVPETDLIICAPRTNAADPVAVAVRVIGIVPPALVVSANRTP